MLTWPSDLPQTSLLADYNTALGDGRTKSTVTAGVGKGRAFWSGFRKESISINMDSNQWARLKLFWDIDTEHGVLPFTMVDSTSSGPLLTTGGIPIIPILVVRRVLCKFGDSPPAISQAYTGSLFKVSFPLDIYP